MKTAIETKNRITLLGKIDSVSEDQFKEAVTDAQAKQSTEDALAKQESRDPNTVPVPELVGVQSFTKYSIETDEDFALLVPELKERINLVNRALGIKQNQYIRDFMTDEKFEPVEGSIDLVDVCAKPTERRAASPTEKAAKLLKDAGLTPEQFQEFFNMVMAQAQGQASPTTAE